MKEDGVMEGGVKEVREDGVTEAKAKGKRREGGRGGRGGREGGRGEGGRGGRGGREGGEKKGREEGEGGEKGREEGEGGEKGREGRRGGGGERRDGTYVVLTAFSCSTMSLLKRRNLFDKSCPMGMRENCPVMSSEMDTSGEHSLQRVKKHHKQRV